MQKIATMKYNSDSDECTADEAFDTQGIILKYIDKVPNIRHRELLRLSGLSNGMLEYHLKILEGTDKITVFRRDGRRAGYYPIYMPTEKYYNISETNNVLCT
jgi:predicted transcriptional regulator